VPDAGEEKDVCSRRPDGAAIDSMKKTLYSLELTRTTHERADVEERARERAQRQYEDVIGGLTEVGRSMGRGWSVRLPTLVGGHQCAGVGTQEAIGRTCGGTSSPSIQEARNWGQAGETATRGAGHGVRMLLCRQMGETRLGGGEGERRQDRETHNSYAGGGGGGRGVSFSS
jgi:hypothetical protein